MPSSSSCDHVEEFIDTIDQLNEIVLKYHLSHRILIGGDINEDLGDPARNNKRKKYMTDFIQEHRLKYENSGKTFIKEDGEECSELDYFLHKTGPLNCTKKEVLNTMMSCTSDHHPVKIILSMGMSEKAIENKNDTNQINPKIKWDKVDQDLYIAMINEGVEKISKQPVVMQEDTLNQLATVLELLQDTAITCSSSKATYQAKPKLKVWSENIRKAWSEMKKQ